VFTSVDRHVQGQAHGSAPTQNVKKIQKGRANLPGLFSVQIVPLLLSPAQQDHSGSGQQNQNHSNSQYNEADIRHNTAAV